MQRIVTALRFMLIGFSNSLGTDYTVLSCKVVVIFIDDDDSFHEPLA